MRKGLPVSPGVAIGKAYVLDEVLGRIEPQRLGETQVSQELVAFDQACAAALEELHGVTIKVSRQIGSKEADIFRSHQAILKDPALVAKVKQRIITQRVDARAALHDVLNEYTSLFARVTDEYIKERVVDIRDVIARLLSRLSTPDQEQFIESDEPVILVAHEVLPSQAMSLGRMKISGIVTETGGSTSHAAILARSMGIPAISGVGSICHQVETGQEVIVDGREGHVMLSPDPETLTAYRKLQREFIDLKDALVETREQPAVTADGVRIELLANINSLEDARAAAVVGADGVGLYRTEYLFLTHPSVPNEEEQLAAYREILEALGELVLTIRTVDLGGDKTIPYLGGHPESNPFMGWRSIRLSFEHPQFFQTQIRAILRASQYGKLRIMFPMITTLEELRRVNRMVKRTKQELENKHIPFDVDVQTGVMIEVPAAALCASTLLAETDFASIGSNDLVQYLMAADRDNPKVSHLCDPCSPPAVRMLKQVIDDGRQNGKPVSLCGEMAGRPRSALLLLGMGLRSFSMSPAFVPTMKEILSNVSISEAEQIAVKALTMTTTSQIRAYLTRQLKRLCPKLVMLDMA